MDNPDDQDLNTESADGLPNPNGLAPGETAPSADARPDRPPRMKVLKGGHIAFNQEYSAIPCTIRDMSENGARLIVHDSFMVPETFMLFVDIDGYKIECERVRTSGAGIGVRFIGERISTGKARQQVIFPDKLLAQAAAEELKDMAGKMRDADRGSSPQPVRRPNRPTGFGRRTR